MVADKDVAAMLDARRERLREEKRKAKEESLSPRTRESRRRREERIARERDEYFARIQREREEADAAADELAQILSQRLTAEEWQRAKVLFTLHKAFTERYEKDERIIPIIMSMEAIEVSKVVGAEEQQSSPIPNDVEATRRDAYADLETPSLLRRSAA